MKKFNNPELEIAKLDVADVITVSGCETDCTGKGTTDLPLG